MKSVLFLSAIVFIIAGYGFLGDKPVGGAPEKAVEQVLVAQIDSFSAMIDTLGTATGGSASGSASPADQKRLQQLFLLTRLSYKRFEWAAEYFNSWTTQFVNGAPVPEVDIPGQRVFDPAGLQVIESILFPKYDTARRLELIHQLQRISSGCTVYKAYYTNIPVSNWQVFDAARLEVFRILTLGIAGFDAPISLNSMEEAAVSLESLRTVIGRYGDSLKVTGELDAAAYYLRKHPDFNSFDRAAFITQYANKITSDLLQLQRQLKIPVIKYNRLLRQDAATLFDENAFDENAYGPGDEYVTTDKKIALGKRLFLDPVLSGPGTRSCATCHQPQNAFTDGLIKNAVIRDTAYGRDMASGTGQALLLRRNTPTLINAALQPAQFYDMRAATLEDQVYDVVQNKEEMHGNLQEVAKRLWRDSVYRRLFSDAFPVSGRTSIDTFEVMNAIASYVRSLTQLNSRFDEYMRGNKAAMNDREIAGFNLFMGKAKCGTCHYMPLFNGTLPPDYSKDEPEVIGVPRFADKPILDTDRGMFNIMSVAAFDHAFKTVTVRNAARTAPYMHNGVFATLKEVLDFYNEGGGQGKGASVDNQTLSPDKLHLDTTEVSEVIDFIECLDSK